MNFYPIYEWRFGELLVEETERKKSGSGVEWRERWSAEITEILLLHQT